MKDKIDEAIEGLKRIGYIKHPSQVENIYYMTQQLNDVCQSRSVLERIESDLRQIIVGHYSKGVDDIEDIGCD